VDFVTTETWLEKTAALMYKIKKSNLVHSPVHWGTPQFKFSEAPCRKPNEVVPRLGSAPRRHPQRPVCAPAMHANERGAVPCIISHARFLLCDIFALAILLCACNASCCERASCRSLQRRARTLSCHPALLLCDIFVFLFHAVSAACPFRVAVPQT